MLKERISILSDVVEPIATVLTSTCLVALTFFQWRTSQAMEKLERSKIEPQFQISRSADDILTNMPNVRLSYNILPSQITRAFAVAYGDIFKDGIKCRVRIAAMLRFDYSTNTLFIPETSMGQIRPWINFYNHVETEVRFEYVNLDKNPGIAKLPFYYDGNSAAALADSGELRAIDIDNAGAMRIKIGSDHIEVDEERPLKPNCQRILAFISSLTTVSIGHAHSKVS